LFFRVKRERSRCLTFSWSTSPFSFSSRVNYPPLSQSRTRSSRRNSGPPSSPSARWRHMFMSAEQQVASVAGLNMGDQRRLHTPHCKQPPGRFSTFPSSLSKRSPARDRGPAACVGLRVDRSANQLSTVCLRALARQIGAVVERYAHCRACANTASASAAVRSVPYSSQGCVDGERTAA